MNAPSTTSLNTELSALTDLFLLNPKNRAFIEGKTKRTRPPKRERGQLAPYLVVSVILLFGMGIAFEGLLLLLSSATTHGVVTSRWITQSYEGDVYHLGYSFSLPGQQTSYTEYVDVDKNVYDGVVTESSIEVVYWTRNPAVSRTPSAHSDVRVTFLCFFCPFLLIQVYWFDRYRRARRRRWFDLHGQLLRGEIVSYSSKDRGDAGCRFTLCYRFQNPSGKLIDGVKIVDYGTEWNGIYQAKEEAPIAVLYVHDTAHNVL